MDEEIKVAEETQEEPQEAQAEEQEQEQEQEQQAPQVDVSAELAALTESINGISQKLDNVLAMIVETAGSMEDITDDIPDGDETPADDILDIDDLDLSL